MTMPVTTDQTVLQITRTFRASREKVFQAWTTPGALKQWFGPSAEFSIPVAELDLRVGGRYRIQMVDPKGQTHTAIGEYREIARPEKLVFTWSWEGGAGCDETPLGETLVTIELRQKATETEMTLTHELFPNAQTRDNHYEGWNGCLERLGQFV